MSGDALSRVQSMSFALIAIDDWVRGFARMLPSLTPRQFAQLQFHCGKPPPALEPSMRIRMTLIYCRLQGTASLPKWGPR